MNIYMILHEEHVKVQAAIERLRKIRVDGRKRLLDEVIDELTSHSQAEEQVLYDRLGDNVDLREPILEAREEHQMVTRLLDDLYGIRAEDERFEAKITVLGETLKHHIEEEETLLFPRAQHLFEDVIAQNFAGEFVAAKEKIRKMPLLLRLGRARVNKVVADVSHAIRPDGGVAR